MRARLTGAAAALALAVPAAVAAPALAQGPLPPLPTLPPVPSASPSPSATPSPSPSPTPTATPTPEEQARAERDARDRRSKEVRRIYRDFERDGFIDDCDHTRKALKRALRSISKAFDEANPDFRAALKAAIERHNAGTCSDQQAKPKQQAGGGSSGSGGTSGGGTSGGGTSGGGTSGGGGGTTTSPGTLGGGTTPAPAPAPAPPSPAAPQSGTLPGGGTSKPPKSSTVTPLPGEGAIPEGTPAPPAATPAPPPPAAPQPPALAVTRAAADPNLFVPGTMLAIALLGLLFAGLSAVAARRTGRLAGVDQAWREAAFRASGAWSDFADWLRRGR